MLLIPLKYAVIKFLTINCIVNSVK